jgi:hypothetical protein
MNTTLEELRTKVFTALGAVSACWDHLEGAGLFLDQEAADVGNSLIEWIDQHYEPRT